MTGSSSGFCSARLPGPRPSGSYSAVPPTAERVVLGSATHGGAYDDYANSLDTITGVVGEPKEAELLIAWLWQRAFNTLSLPHLRAAVEAIAAELYDANRVSGSMCRELYDAAADHTPVTCP